MVVTSVVFWLFFTIYILILYSIHFTYSVKMTYGLVYRPAPLHKNAGASTAQSSIKSNAVYPNESLANEVANETKIYVRTEPAADDLRNSALTSSDAKILKNSTTIHNLKYSKKDVPAWMLQTGLTSHQYQVYENDSEAEESKHHSITDDGYHESFGQHGKKNKKGSSGEHVKEEKVQKKGGKAHKEKHGKKSEGKKGGYKSYAKKEGGSKIYEHKNKKGETGSNKKYKKHHVKKGFEDKYKLDKEDKVHKFWHDHQEHGEFYVYGKKKKSRHENKKDKKNNKWKKSNKKSKKKKKQQKKERKEGKKEDKGYDEEKGSKKFYHKEEEYGSKKKSNFHKTKDKKN